MRQRSLLFVFGLAALSFSQLRSTASAQNSAAAAATPEPASATGVSESYRLASHDELMIRVFREEDLTTQTRVEKNGTITFPLIGNVPVLGQTPQQAAKTIERLLRADYLVDPQVQVSVLEYSKRRFTILGQVGKPGTVEFPEDSGVNLLEAIGMAGGYTRIALPSRITVKRIVDGKEVTYKLDAKKMAKDTNTEIFQVLPGDIITVAESIF